MVENSNQMALEPAQLLHGHRVRRILPSAQITQIGTWNLRSIHLPGKLANVVKEIKRMRIDILRIAEHRWIGNEKINLSR